MRVAALFDIHGNLPALEAVLTELDEESVDEIVVGGDVLWGALQAECVELLAARDALFLAGNCEREVRVGDSDADQLVSRTALARAARSRLDLARRRLSSTCRSDVSCSVMRRLVRTRRSSRG